MKNINIKISLWLVSLIFIMSISNYTNAQKECDSIIKVIIVEPPVGPPPVVPPVIVNPPVGDPDELGPEDGEAYINLFKSGYKRDVFFVHGLDGSSGSWDRVIPYVESGNGEPDFDGWEVEAWSPSYLENQTSIYGAAAELDDDIDEAELLPILSDNFIIAHSLGGLVSRRYDADQAIQGSEKKYGGIISFGSPHLGSPAATRLYDGTLNSIIKNSCLSFAKGPAVEFQYAESDWFLSLLGNFGFFNIEELVESFCDNDEKIGELVQKLFSPVVVDLIPGNPVLNELNSYIDPNISKMAFYGVEDDDQGQMFWSIAYSARTGVNSVPLFQADDNAAINEMKSTQGQYTRKYELWNTIAENYSIFMVCCPFCSSYRLIPIDKDGNGTFDNLKCITRNKVRLIRDSYRLGRDYSYNLNEIWKNVIGTYNYQVNGYGCQYWVDETTLEVMPVSDPNDCLAFGDDLFGILEYSQTTADDSDGLVLKSSAVAYPGVNYPPVKMDGSNHFQMRNDGNTRDAMLGIFDGRYLKFFETPKR